MNIKPLAEAIYEGILASLNESVWVPDANVNPSFSEFYKEPSLERIIELIKRIIDERKLDPETVLDEARAESKDSLKLAQRVNQKLGMGSDLCRAWCERKIVKF